MKKSIILGGSILCLFILVSLSYQPIVADMPIETITQANKSKASNLDADELKELYNRLIELKSQSNDDCGCGNDNLDDEETISWHFPYICTLILLPMVLFLFMIWYPFYRISEPPELFTIIADIAWELGCWWTFQ